MRLINAEDAYIVLVDEYHLRSVVQSYALMEALDKVPTVDAVPVVRCKDCKYFTESERVDKRGWCSLSQHGCPMSDDYCSDAERKAEDATD